MKKYLSSVAAAVMFAMAGSSLPRPATAAEDWWKYSDLVTNYCVTCHNFVDLKPDGRPLMLDNMSLGDLNKDLVSWERVVRRLSLGQMPPQGAKHPDTKELVEFRAWLVGKLDALGEKRNHPGEFPLRRLNRTEYANAIRDIFGLKVDIGQYLPPDSSDAGFDNVATALTLTPALMDRYLTTAVQVSNMVVGDPAVETQELVVPLRLDINQAYHVEGLPLGTRGGTLVHYNFSADGKYRLAGELIRAVDNSDQGLEGQNKPSTFEILIDGVRVHAAQMGGVEDHNMTRDNLTLARKVVGERMTAEISVTAGPHDVGFTFIDRPDRSEDVYKPALRASQDIHVTNGFPALTLVTIEGPLGVTGVSDNPLRNRLFVCKPGPALTAEACAHQILSNVSRLAYRRPVTEDDMASVMEFFAAGQKNGGFDAGIRAALPRILTNPSFVLRTEVDPEDMAPGTVHKVTDVELASRLSFFLWSSVPDDELLTLAQQNKLHEPRVLKAQVRRMVADEKAKALTTNFPDQWLALRNLDTVAPDLIDFPEWDYDLRLAAQQETRLFFDSLIREDRSVLDLLSADYTFMNGQLALHYGVPGIYGTAFRRVKLDDPNRHGLLGQASILTLTSVATRTSPVLRGKWVLTNLIGTPPLPPPDNVDTTLKQEEGASPRSVRELLEKHRENPVCDSCHRNMDPIGFALENYNAIGQWRKIDKFSGTAVDSKGKLSDGTMVSNPYELSQAMVGRPDVFVGLVTEKLMTYALGRAMDAPDMPMVRDVVRQAKEDDYRFMPLILAIVESPAFQSRNVPVRVQSAALQ